MSAIKFTTEKEYNGYIKVNSCGKQWLGDRDYNTIRENGRIDFSINYIKKGIGYCEYNGKNMTIPEGSLVFFHPNVRHHYYFKKEDCTEMCWSHFSGTACSILSDFEKDIPVIIAIRDRKQFESAFEKMIYAYYNKQLNEEELCDGYMLVLLSLIKESAKKLLNVSNTNVNTGLEKVLSDMHVYFNKPIDIKKYAQMCHLSEDSFIRMFKKNMGYPPYRYQLRIRIERAVEMLENSGLNVSECGEAVGFSDNAYFCRIFKKITGYPPSKYKK